MPKTLQFILLLTLLLALFLISAIIKFDIFPLSMEDLIQGWILLYRRYKFKMTNKTKSQTPALG